MSKIGQEERKKICKVESGSFRRITLTAVLDYLTRLFIYLFFFCAIAAGLRQGKYPTLHSSYKGFINPPALSFYYCIPNTYFRHSHSVYQFHSVSDHCFRLAIASRPFQFSNLKNNSGIIHFLIKDQFVCLS